MMIGQWRSFLYPIGFLSSLLFSARFLYQWLDSEFKRKSSVNALFWWMSLAGNILLYIHSVVQMQLHVALIQAGNAVISYRNLDLMRAPSKQKSLPTVLIALVTALVATIALFAVQAHLFPTEASGWLRTPSLPYMNAPVHVGAAWHILGTVGLLAFSCRFWIQWWHIERRGVSTLSASFFQISLVGALMTLVYFARIKDPVNLIGPLFGIVPYVRNLMLLKRATES